MNQGNAGLDCCSLNAGKNITFLPSSLDFLECWRILNICLQRLYRSLVLKCTYTSVGQSNDQKKEKFFSHILGFRPIDANQVMAHTDGQLL